MSTLPRGPLTRAQLDALPDDGWRHELVDGALVMTPAPSRRHQSIVVEVVYLLRGVCPPGRSVLVAPFDVALAPDTIVQPDVLVARTADLTSRDLPTAPLLAVEVLSPSTRHIDRGLKLARYESAGCPSYWVIDPGEDDVAPSIVVWHLREGRYDEVARASGEDRVELEQPFPVRFRPADLVG